MGWFWTKFRPVCPLALKGLGRPCRGRLSSVFVDSIIGLLYAGLGCREELEDAVQMDPRELDDGMFSIHELRETDHAFSSGCAR
jgi:hypothetical protein